VRVRRSQITNSRTCPPLHPFISYPPPFFLEVFMWLCYSRRDQNPFARDDGSSYPKLMAQKPNPNKAVSTGASKHVVPSLLRQAGRVPPRGIAGLPTAHEPNRRRYDAWERLPREYRRSALSRITTLKVSRCASSPIPAAANGSIGTTHQHRTIGIPSFHENRQTTTRRAPGFKDAMRLVDQAACPTEGGQCFPERMLRRTGRV